MLSLLDVDESQGNLMTRQKLIQPAMRQPLVETRAFVWSGALTLMKKKHYPLQQSTVFVTLVPT
jgi:hypothetical protein